jgi:hypothetical protein
MHDEVKKYHHGTSLPWQQYNAHIHHLYFGKQADYINYLENIGIATNIYFLHSIKLKLR